MTSLELEEPMGTQDRLAPDWRKGFLKKKYHKMEGEGGKEKLDIKKQINTTYRVENDFQMGGGGFFKKI